MAILRFTGPDLQKFKFLKTQKNGICLLPSQRLTLGIDSVTHFRPGRAFSALSTKIEFYLIFYTYPWRKVAH